MSSPPKSLLGLFAILISQMAAQTPPIIPSGTFDIHLQQLAGRGAPIAFFVARNSHLYFVVSTANGSMVFLTTEDGVVQSAGSLGPEPISGFDVDEAGNSYVLYRDSHLAEFNSEWGFKQAINLHGAILSFALVGGKPMGVDSDGRLGFLNKEGAAFTLKAYPAPWLLFAAGPDRIGILRPQAPSVHVFQVDGAWSTHTMGLGRMPIAAVATPAGQIYLLASPRARSASIIECDDRGAPRFIFDYLLPEAFNPRMIGISGERIYIVDPEGKVAFYAISRKPSAPQAIDSGPELLSDLAPLYAAVRKTGYTGHVVIELDVSELGIPEHARLQSPLSLVAVPEIADAVRQCRFRPAIQSGKPAMAPMNLDIDVR